jgi:pimeloyl-ACP methyl ester carboxylesterase
MQTSKRITAMSLAGLLILPCYTLVAESGSNPAVANVAGFTNLDFEQGTAGGTPPGWNIPKALKAQGFSAILTTNQSNHGKQCAEIRWPSDRRPSTSQFANLMQSVDATPWRNQRIKVTAAIRVASAENGQRSQMWLRVDCPGGGGAFDNMDDRPVVSTNWADYSITADVAEDAQKLNLGLMTLNGTTAWWDNVRIEVLNEFHSKDLDVLEGNWKGALEVGPISLRVFFVFERDATNRLRGYFVSLDQSETRLPLRGMTLSGNSVDFTVSAIGGRYTGQLDRASREMKGTWNQGSRAFPLALAFTAADWKLRRPQTPKPPFPYQAEDVMFENTKCNVKLAGTLTRPTGAGPFPAVVLITGSGPQDRDETLFGHKPFAVIADFLSRNGYAILRYDDRGFGKSSGDFGSATSEDFSYDAEAALDYLKTRREIEPRRIGFLGHSEGGLIAAMIGARRADVGFVILLAAPGIAGDEIALAQAETFSRTKGFSDEGIQKCRPLNRETIRMFRSNLSLDEKKAKLKELEQRMILLMGENDRQLYEKLKDRIHADSEFGIVQTQSAWMQFMLRYDPVADFQRLKCPVLALNGELDRQVLASQNLPAIEKNLKAGGNTRFTTKELKGLNHLFQTAKTGELKEYGEIEETLSPSALSEILTWLTAYAKSSVSGQTQRTRTGGL